MPESNDYNEHKVLHYTDERPYSSRLDSMRFPRTMLLKDVRLVIQNKILTNNK